MSIKKDMYIMLSSIKESLEEGILDKGIISYENTEFSQERGGMIIKMLVDERLIKGFREVKIDGAPFPHFIKTSPSITLEGLNYLEENSNIAKTLSAAEKVKAITPFI